MNTLLFTHIPKTAGRSMRIGVFESHVPKERRGDPSGYWSALRSRGAYDLLAGHGCAYGIHRLYGISDPRYFVMLRKPVDRVVSYYYFVAQSANQDSYTHPSLRDVRENDLAGFYRLPVYQNVQTRYVAGLGWEYVGRYLNLNGRIGEWALSRAKQNLLQKYEAFGLKEQFEKSARLMASRLGIEPRLPDKQYKATSDRPDVSDLKDSVRQSLRRSNSLDAKLYAFAQKHFDSQFSGVQGNSASNEESPLTNR